MKKSLLSALLIVVVASVWILLGLGKSEPTPQTPTVQAPDTTVMLVEVVQQRAESITAFITGHGDVHPSKKTLLSAETFGRIVSLFKEQGDRVEQDDVILEIDPSDAQFRLEQAEALVAQAENEYKAQQSLQKQGYSSASALESALANLKAAQAQQESAAQTLRKSRVTAPFSGVLYDQHIEQGSFVSIGTPVIALVQNDPLTIRTQISQRDIRHLKVGNDALVQLATGEELSGTITFVSPVADSQTRTFTVEFEVDNPTQLPSGTSAEVKIPKSTEQAHFVSAALLTLSDQGEIGIKTVDDQQMVRFYEVEILSATHRGVYVTGLPDNVAIITLGHGFVEEGDQVRTLAAHSNTPQSDRPTTQKNL